MAKNPNNDDEGGILNPKPKPPTTKPPGDGENPSIKSIGVNSKYISDNALDRINDLAKRPKWLVYSFIALALVMLASFAIPDKVYSRNVCVLLLNVELLILFGRDIFLYFKKSCKIIRIIMLLMTGIYVVNIVDLLVNIPHVSYLIGCILAIITVLCLIYIIGGFRNK